VPDDRFQVLAELAVHGANIQAGQVVGVAAELGQEELARAIAAAAYGRGALYVDVNYFDPWVKRERILHAPPDTLDYVPPWIGFRMATLGERHDATITIAGVVSPQALEGADPVLAGRDRLPWVKERGRVVSHKLINWTIVPCPHPAWAQLVYPELPDDEAYERLWRELWHVLRLDEPDPAAAWNERSDALKRSAAAGRNSGHTSPTITTRMARIEAMIRTPPRTTSRNAQRSSRIRRAVRARDAARGRAGASGRPPRSAPVLIAT